MANSTILSLVQSFCREYGLSVPTALQGSSDAGALQMRELLRSTGEEIWARTNWQKCARTASWISVAGSAQGNVDTLFPESLSHIIPQTFWDRTARLAVAGPLSDFNWQTNAAYGLSTPSYFYRISNNQLQMQSSMPAGHTLSLIYKTRNWIQSGASVVTEFVADSDTCLFPDALMKKGLRAFWLRIKQMPHRLEFEAFEDALSREAATNTVAPVLSLDARGSQGTPGILIPLGNWMQP